MKNLDELRPCDLAEFAERDCDRLIAKMGAEKVDFLGDGVQHIASGSGPTICLKSGYESFKAAYQAGTHSLLKQIASELSANLDCHRLSLAFAVESESGFGDYGRHVWNLYK